jgi:hypothetical protein
MKKLILVIAIIFGGILVQAQIEIKGIELGSTYEGEEKIETTLGGYKGELTIQTLNDLRVYTIIFKSSPNNPDIKQDEHENMRNAIESKYGFKFKEPMSFSAGDSLYSYDTGVYSFSYLSFETGFWVLLVNLNLLKIKQSQEQEKIIDDL